MADQIVRKSPFLSPSVLAAPGDLAMLQLKRDSLLPIILHEGASDQGYAEGAVINTRFGSFPHSTLIGLPWGSQVRASKVDTGSRGRPSKKRKTDEAELDRDEEAEVGRKSKAEVKAAIEAGTGFVHLLDPTPETWTASLDHRTQVVYTPDYSYILPRIRASPGSRLIEAGAGSGSFTHAAVRAIYNGISASEDIRVGRCGHVFSYEYHEPRAETLRKELEGHRLDKVVTLTHRDVCADGFMLEDGSSPMASAIFLDLPAPWQALQHLSRNEPSALDPKTTTHLCTFSPCIEQVTATVSYLRKAGWTEIEMVEVQHKRLDVRRDLIGTSFEGLRGVNTSPANVEEALERLREVDNRFNEFRNFRRAEKDGGEKLSALTQPESKQARLERMQKEAATKRLYREGNLVHRTEPEVRTHTSYLVFAVLPRAWTDEDEETCLRQWSVDRIE